MHNRDVETRDWSLVASEHDALFRTQIAYLFASSDFYRSKLTEAGFADAASVGGLEGIAALPFTEKDELRASVTPERPIGAHLAAPMADVVRIYSTSGTTGTPSYIPLTAEDVANWIEISARSYGASGIAPGEKLITTYNAGPFVAGLALDSLPRLGICHLPMGSGNTERVMSAITRMAPEAIVMTPSYALHLGEWARARGIDLPASAVRRVLVAGEPGGGQPAMRATLETAWGARVTEAMGLGDIAVSLWGECPAQGGMHFSGRGLVHFELIDPETGTSLPLVDGAEGELVYTHLRQRGAPLLRFRSRDHARLSVGTCACGRTAPRVRCIGRTDDMLIVRGVNVFPSALREVVSEFAPQVSGVIAVRPAVPGVKQAPPLPLRVELGPGVAAEDALNGTLAERIRSRIRERLIVTTEIELVAHGSLPRSDYKSRLIDWSAAQSKETQA